ncbi:hypothetical protein AWB64_06217 [Caballeronia sordidicola]|uniref:Uncharacterized protein n=1 Tax=Caballeronia sordidicola TaxID=196367 RepID=A0A158II99_CABSO|nr:hypothetical protein AWB64_06217 [Caballeronia sordidicola]
MMCALQPEVREITKSGVNMAVGTPIAWYETALNQSRFGNIFFASHMVVSSRSATSYIFVSPASFESFFAMSLITLLRGSEIVYTGWPKPITTSFASTRRRISASASSGV